MASQLEPYVDAKFLQAEINTQYTQIINCEFVQEPYRNLLHRENLDNKHNDNQQYFVRKRKGFKEIPTYTRLAAAYNGDASGTATIDVTLGNRTLETNLDQPDSNFYGGEFTDSVVREGRRRFMRVNDTRTRLRIYTHEGANRDLCMNREISPLDSGWITCVAEHHIEPCNADKFIMTTTAKQRKRLGPDSSSVAVAGSFRLIVFKFRREEVMTGSHIDIDGVTETTNVLSDIDEGHIFYAIQKGGIDDGGVQGIGPGDYIHLEDRGLTVVAGMRLKNSGIDDNLRIRFGLSADALLIADTSLSNYFDLTFAGLPALYKTFDNIPFSVYTRAGTTLSYVTAQGLVTITDYSEESNRLSLAKAANSVRGRTYISACKYADRVLLLDEEGTMLVSGGGVYEQRSFPAKNWVDIGREISVITPYSDMVLLMGPDVIQYYRLAKSTDANLSTTGEGFQLGVLSEKSGLYGKHSYDTKDNILFILRDDKTLYTMQMSYGSPVFEYFSGYLASHLYNLNRNTDDAVIDVTDRNTYVIMHDEGPDSKLMIQDRGTNVRYMWMMQGVRITRIIDGMFLGDKIRSNEGETDNGNPITQMVSYVYGNEGLSTRKHFAYVKIPLGVHSKITKDTTITKKVLSGGKEYVSRDYLTTAEFVALLASTEKEEVIKTYPIGWTIAGHTPVQECILGAEFKSYVEFGAMVEQETLFDDEHPITAKYGVVKSDINHNGEILELTLVARRNDKFEFGGFFLGSYYLDFDHTEINNELHLSKIFQPSLTFNSN